MWRGGGGARWPRGGGIIAPRAASATPHRVHGDGCWMTMRPAVRGCAGPGSNVLPCTVPGTGVGCPGMAGGRAAQGPAGGWIERQQEGPGSAFLAGTKLWAPTQCCTEPDPEFKVFLSNGEVSANLDFMRSCLKIIIIKKPNSPGVTCAPKAHPRNRVVSEDVYRAKLKSGSSTW